MEKRKTHPPTYTTITLDHPLFQPRCRRRLHFAIPSQGMLQFHRDLDVPAATAPMVDMATVQLSGRLLARVDGRDPLGLIFVSLCLLFEIVGTCRRWHILLFPRLKT